MKSIRIEAPEHWNAVRGPDLVRWITDEDLRFSGIGGNYASAKSSIRGALCHDYWVLFFEMQVVQLAPDEVHSGWHYEYRDGTEHGSAWKILDSEWLKSFSPRHLDGYSHFLVGFYDDVVEVICKDVLFGKTPFDLAQAIEKFPKFCFPYLQLARSNKDFGDKDLAIQSFEKYQSLSPDPKQVEYVKRCLTHLKNNM